MWLTGTRCLDFDCCAFPPGGTQTCFTIKHGWAQGSVLAYARGTHGRCDVLGVLEESRGSQGQVLQGEFPGTLRVLYWPWWACGPLPRMCFISISAQHNSLIINTLDSLPEWGPHSYLSHQPAGRLDMQQQAAVNP